MERTASAPSALVMEQLAAIPEAPVSPPGSSAQPPVRRSKGSVSELTVKNHMLELAPLQSHLNFLCSCTHVHRPDNSECGHGCRQNSSLHLPVHGHHPAMCAHYTTPGWQAGSALALGAGKPVERSRSFTELFGPIRKACVPPSFTRMPFIFRAIHCMLRLQGHTEYLRSLAKQLQRPEPCRHSNCTRPQAYPSGGTSSSPTGSYLVDTAWLHAAPDAPPRSANGFPVASWTAAGRAERQDPFEQASLGSFVATKRSDSQVGTVKTGDTSHPLPSAALGDTWSLGSCSRTCNAG